MIVSEAFKTEDNKELTIKKILDGKAMPNLKKFKKLKSDSEKYFNEINKNWEEIQKFYNGDQWRTIRLYRPALSVNSVGDPVYDVMSTYGEAFSNPENKKPRRVVNLIKARVQSLVAYHAQTDPFPVAEPKNDYIYNAEELKKINLLLEAMFKGDNNLKNIYKLTTEEAYKFGYSVVEIAFDKDNAPNTQIPIVLNIVPQQDIGFDPNAKSIESSQYLIHKVHLKYWQFLNRYNYDEDNKKKIPDYDSDIELEHYWFRVTDKDGDSSWVCFPIYQDNLLHFKTGGNYTDGLQFPVCPFVVIRHTVTKQIHGATFIPDLIPSQIEYNMTVSEHDWNWRRYIDPTTIISGTGTTVVDDIKKAQVPGGVAVIGAAEAVNAMKYDLVLATEFETRKASIKKDMDDIAGSIETILGGKGKGVYSNALFESMQEGQERTPQMREEVLLACLQTLTNTMLELTADYLGASSIVLFDPSTYNTVSIGANDIQKATYTINIKIKDVNLLSKSKRFEMLQQIFQYAGFTDHMDVYWIARLFNSHYSGLIPDDVMKMMKENMAKKTLQTTQPTNAINAPQETAQGVTSGNPTIPENRTVQEPENTSSLEITMEEFVPQVITIKNELLKLGLTSDQINPLIEQTVESVGDMIPFSELINTKIDLVKKYGVSLSDILQALYETKDKVSDIIAKNSMEE